MMARHAPTLKTCLCRCRGSGDPAGQSNLDPMANKLTQGAEIRQQATRLMLEVGTAEAGQRLDRFLSARLPHLSRSRLQALLRAGEVSRDGTVVLNLSGKVKVGENYEVR